MKESLNHTKQPSRFESLGEGFSLKGQRIYVRIRVNGKLTWRSTGTNKLAQARKWREKWDNERWNLKHGIESRGVVLQQSRMTVNQMIDEYVAAGQPIIFKRALKPKSARTIRGETYCFNPIRDFFGHMLAGNLGLPECDRYCDWRNSGGYVATFKVRSKTVTKRTRGGTRAVDLELTALSNALALAVRRGHLKINPLRDRGRYTDKATIRHCRETAPTPEELRQIVAWMKKNEFLQAASFARFLAYSGLRIGEGLNAAWGSVNWSEKLIHVVRLKKGVIPWVPLLPEMQELLEEMRNGAGGKLMFPSSFDPNRPFDPSAFRRQLAKACKELAIRHVTPHGLRSYFVTQARQSGLTDAEIAQLIGDKTGPSIIAAVYGDVRPDHLLAVARKIQLTATTRIVGA